MNVPSNVRKHRRCIEKAHRLSIHLQLPDAVAWKRTPAKYRLSFSAQSKNRRLIRKHFR